MQAVSSESQAMIWLSSAQTFALSSVDSILKDAESSGLPSQGKEERSMRSFPTKEGHQHDLYVQDGIPIFDVIDITTNALA